MSFKYALASLLLTPSASDAIPDKERWIAIRQEAEIGSCLDLILAKRDSGMPLDSGAIDAGIGRIKCAAQILPGTVFVSVSSLTQPSTNVIALFPTDGNNPDIRVQYARDDYSDTAQNSKKRLGLSLQNAVAMRWTELQKPRYPGWPFTRPTAASLPTLNN